MLAKGVVAPRYTLNLTASLLSLLLLKRTRLRAACRYRQMTACQSRAVTLASCSHSDVYFLTHAM